MSPQAESVGGGQSHVGDKALSPRRKEAQRKKTKGVWGGGAGEKEVKAKNKRM